MATRGVVTDVGNDILYGFTPEQTLEWVEEAVRRLGRVTGDIVIGDLPLASIRSLSNPKFLAFRSILVPSCRLSLAEVLARSERVSEGLAALATATGSRFVRPDPSWYGFDPIHVRRSSRRGAWRHVLGIDPSIVSTSSWSEGIRLLLAPPERRWLFGVEQLTPQTGVTLRSGGRVWIY